jgi:hypothetical protein
MGFHNSDYDLIRSMKRDASYHFSYPFEYIIDRVGDEDSDEYVLGETTIFVQLDWLDNGNDSHQAPGYQVSYAVYNYADIPASFNGTEREIFDQKWFDFQNDLAAAGIDVRAVETF